jgi:IMP dehydrogenase
MKHTISPACLLLQRQSGWHSNNRDLRFEEDVPQKIADVMTKDNLITAPWVRPLLMPRICASAGWKSGMILMIDFNLRGLITIKDIRKPTVSQFSQARPRPTRVAAAVELHRRHPAAGAALEKAGLTQLLLIPPWPSAQCHRDCPVHKRIPDRELIAGKLPPPRRPKL